MRFAIKFSQHLSGLGATVLRVSALFQISKGIEKELSISFSKADQYTVADAIRRYRKEILPHKTNDGENIARHFNRWEAELDHLKLSRLNQSVIAEVRDKMFAENIRPDQLRSNSTVSRYLASLSHVLSAAVREWQWIAEINLDKFLFSLLMFIIYYDIIYLNLFKIT